MIQKSLPGMNAAAVGLVFAAGYVLFEKGIVRNGPPESVGNFPYYAVVAGICMFLLMLG